VLLVIAFEFHLDTLQCWVIAIPVLGCLFLLQLGAPSLAVSLLAGPLLLGPIVRINLPGGLLLHVGDLAVGVLIVGSIVRRGRRAALRLGEYEIPILLLILLVLVGWLVGLDPVASTPSMVALLEMLALYIFATSAVATARDADVMILGWVGAVGLGALLVLVSYLRRDPLLLGVGVEGQRYAETTIASTAYLYRASFFVTGFGYPLVAAILCSAMWIIAKKGNRVLRAGLGAALVLDIVALGLMGGATVAGSVGIGLVLLAFWTLWLPNGFRRAVVFAMVILAGASGVAFVLTRVMSATQLKLLLNRAQSADSLFVRFKVWNNVLVYLLTYPHAMLVGLGPDISIRRGDYLFLRQLFNGAGAQQNAVDSGYLYLLLNYGIFVTLLVVGMALRTLTQLTRMITRSADTTAIALWVSIAVWMVMAVTQQGGVSKPLFMTAQFAALATALYANAAARSAGTA
jgi:hypothetical protein